MKTLSLLLIALILSARPSIALQTKECDDYLTNSRKSCNTDEIQKSYYNPNATDINNKYKLGALRSQILNDVANNGAHFESQRDICLVEAYEILSKRQGYELGTKIGEFKKCKSFDSCIKQNSKSDLIAVYNNSVKEDQQFRSFLAEMSKGLTIKKPIICKKEPVQKSQIEDINAGICCKDVSDPSHSAEASLIFPSQEFCASKIFSKQETKTPNPLSCVIHNLDTIADQYFSRTAITYTNELKNRVFSLVGASRKDDVDALLEKSPPSNERTQVIEKLKKLISEGETYQLPSFSPNSCPKMIRPDVKAKLDCEYTRKIINSISSDEKAADKFFKALEDKSENRGQKVSAAMKIAIKQENKREKNENKFKDEFKKLAQCEKNEPNHVQANAQTAFVNARGFGDKVEYRRDNRGNITDVIIPALFAGGATPITAPDESSLSTPTSVTAQSMTAITGTSGGTNTGSAITGTATPLSTSTTVTNSTGGSTNDGGNSGYNTPLFQTNSSSSSGNGSFSDGGAISSTNGGSQGHQFVKQDPVTLNALKQASDENIKLAQKNWSLENQHTMDDSTIRHQDYKLAKAAEQLQAKKEGGGSSEGGSSEGPAGAVAKNPASVPVPDPKIEKQRKQDEQVVQATTSDIETSLKKDLNLNVQKGSDQEKAISDIVHDLKNKTKITEEDRLEAKRKLIAYFGEEKADYIFTAIEKTLKSKKK